MNCDSFLSCVADPTRHAILRHLAAGPSHVGPLATTVGIEQSNASHHLRQLRECGFVTFERDGKANRYRLSTPAVADFLRAIDATQAAVAQAASSDTPNCDENDTPRNAPNHNASTRRDPLTPEASQ